MEDFDNDGRLDLAVTLFDPTEPMAFYRNKGDGTFEDRTESAGALEQLGARTSSRPITTTTAGWTSSSRGAHGFTSRCRRSCCGTMATARSATSQAGRADRPSSTRPVRAGPTTTTTAGSTSSSLGETQNNRLYRNRGNGTFEDVTAKAGVAAARHASSARGPTGSTTTTTTIRTCSSTICMGDARLYHNNRDGTFTDVTKAMGIDGPRDGFSCWAWDYDNDGWLDIFATCYDYSLDGRGQGTARPAAQAAVESALPQRQRQAVRGQDQGGRTGPGLRRPWEATSATSTTTVSSTSTWAPAIPT